MPDKEKEINPLDLGAKAKHKYKARVNLTLLPETIEWLKEQGQGNASDMIDRLVARARNGEVKFTSPERAVQLKTNQLRSRLMRIRTEVSKLEEKLEQLTTESEK